jgi:hypothetical protein
MAVCKLVVDNVLAYTMLPTADCCLRKCLKPIESRCALSLEMHFLHSHLISFQQALETKAINMVKGFIRTFLLQKIANSLNGISLCWQLKREGKNHVKRYSESVLISIT